jgi:hypothetical protein
MDFNACEQAGSVSDSESEEEIIESEETVIESESSVSEKEGETFY